MVVSTNIICPEYGIGLVPQHIADNWRAEIEWHASKVMGENYPGFRIVDLTLLGRDRNYASYPHTLFAAYHIPTNYPIGRVAIDGEPWSEDQYGTRFYYKYAYVDGIFISEDFQRCGIGTQLMKTAERYYRKMKRHKGIYLQCFQSELPFYKKLGYKICNRVCKDSTIGRYHTYNVDHGSCSFKQRGIFVMYKRF